MEEIPISAVNVAEQSSFDEDKMAKVTLARGDHMMVGLNCFMPGQAHAVHAHEGQDKLYHVLEGEGMFQVGREELMLSVGEQVFVPGGVLHGATNVGAANLVVLVVLSPPPAPKN